jgi:hypothetical protein
MAVIAQHTRLAAAIACYCLLAAGGCAAFPDRIVEPQFHNPFPQLHRVAVLPFYNQSAEPTLNGDDVALAYFNELQLIPGFEVMPVGVAKQLLTASISASGGQEPRGGADFQRLAQLMGVDAVLVGSITEYSPYYPPRVGLSVDWYAANPGFHPIPPGYGLPWGRAEEEFIPSNLVREAEFALAREQLATQTPDSTAGPAENGELRHTQHQHSPAESLPRAQGNRNISSGNPNDLASSAQALTDTAPPPKLPANWPDPRGFIPPPPCPDRPTPHAQHAPLMSHTRIYHGHDLKLTERLATYYYLRDDARFSGRTGYLERPQDFMRFCCYLHVTETLAARGGAGEAQVLWRWPIGRYER